jgi:hypothetical protein
MSLMSLMSRSQSLCRVTRGDDRRRRDIIRDIAGHHPGRYADRASARFARPSLRKLSSFVTSPDSGDSFELLDRASTDSVLTSYSIWFVIVVEPITAPSDAPLILQVSSIVASSGIRLCSYRTRD